MLSLVAALVLISACGGGVAATTNTASVETSTTVATTSASTTTEPRATTTSGVGEAALDFEGDIQAGTEFDVTWTGPDNDRDFVTIVAEGAREGAFEDYFYTSDGATGSLYAPTEAGDYEIRYVDGATNATAASSPTSITGRVITLELPVTVVAGTAFEVSWEAIQASGDYITIVPADARGGTYEDYFYMEDGPTGTLIAPITEGDYEIRYVSGLDSATMAASAIAVSPLEITIDAPATIAPGSEFEVNWTGPDGPGDYLTIVPEGAEPNVYLSYAYTSSGSPLTLVAPEEAGEYEVRYRSDRVEGVFLTVPITVA
ncbi:MAG: hypothetical protein ACR2ME_10735 [Acidimicrobiia bacterium]